jgi:chromosome segregation ATPase
MTTSSIPDLRTRLEAAIKRRDELAQTRQRLLGRLEEAERSLEELRATCRSKNIDPDHIDTAISSLESKLNQSLTALEGKLEEAERALEPFTPRK